MKKATVVLAVAILFLLGFSAPSFAQGLGIGGGPSFPVAEQAFKDFYNTGFNIGLKAKWGSDAAKFVIGAAYTKFSTDKIVNPSGIKTSFTQSLNVLPSISVGGQLTIIPLGPASLYVAADAEYNRITSTIDFDYPYAGGTLPLPIASSETISRVGAAAGAGVEFKLIIFTVDVGAKYHLLNVIGKETDEGSIAFVNANVTVFFAVL